MRSEFVSSRTDERDTRLHRAIWRWHFYAGIFCIPFVLWLSLTGSIYLFRPQIESWLDRPYDHLQMKGVKARPEQIALAAVAAVPHSVLHYYELPPNPDAATRVVVGVGTGEFRVYVHPITCEALFIIQEEHRPMTLLAHLHGQLLAGRWGSYLIELAASWALVLLVTGLYLWWPRQTERLAGVIWVRLGKGQRIFWRDLHAVTGVWISALAIFLILTGLPWANGWGSYFKWVRQVTGTAATKQLWTTGRASELAARTAMNRNSLSAMPDRTGMEHAGHIEPSVQQPPVDAFSAFDRLVPLAASLHLAYPVKIMPAAMRGGTWTIKSDSQDRTLRDVVQADPQTGAIIRRVNFNQTMLIDRMVLTGVAAHEGQLFGPFNQLLGLITTMGLVTLSLSGLIMWWRRRPAGVLGAPMPLLPPRFSWALILLIIALGIYLPFLGGSMILIALTEHFVLSRIPAAQRWLGLAASASPTTAVLLLIMLAASSTALSQTGPPSLTSAQVARIRKIEGRLMAPCCYTQTILDHDSQVAVEMRNEVTALVASGKSEEEIITYYRTKYGETILVVPDGWSGKFLTATPLLLFIASTGLLVLFIRKAVGTNGRLIAQNAPPLASARDDLKQRIRDELGDLG
jgi:uncharacterized iron-regulated membrane protein/cytochrome c-type biogenesis protein CcmH/NrfF